MKKKILKIMIYSNGYIMLLMKGVMMKFLRGMACYNSI